MQTKKILCVTTSWDDGCQLDLKLMRLLEKYELKGTFYIPIKNHERSVMSKSDLIILGKHLEIGSHTYNHKILPGLPSPELINEIVWGKDALEQLMGREVRMFCYPAGKLNRETVHYVKRAGIIGARTTQAFCIGHPRKRFLWPTALQAFPQRPIIHIRHGLIENNWIGLYNYVLRLHMTSDWTSLAIKLFDHALSLGGVWHLWGHSWEIEEYDLWKPLERIFKYVSRRQDVLYLNNGEVIERSFPTELK
jgi:peptidoglycan/xylan/chitin deacetylase (PgdA/CDA1 family)